MISVPLSPSKHPDAPKFAMVDDDCGWLNTWKWCVLKHGKTFYAQRRVENGPNGKHVLMHREIMPGVPLLDHVDGNGWNNLRKNLRASNKSKNAANRGPNRNNTSGFKGVRRAWGCLKWQAKVTCDGREYRLGSFKTPEEAARAYDREAVRLFGRHARINFPIKDSVT